MKQKKNNQLINLFVYDNNFLYSKNFSFCLMFEKNGRFDS